MAIYAGGGILTVMHILAHNSVDHITHAHKSAEHASEPNYLLLVTVFVALVAGAIFVVSRLVAKAQTEKADTQQAKKED